MKTAVWLKRVMVFPVLVTTAFTLSGCGGYPNSPDGVVRGMYDAVQERDQDKYINCLAPDDLTKVV